MLVISKSNAKSVLSLPYRKRESHKGNYGKILIAGGCVGYTGAPALAAKAAVKSGAGLVYLAVPDAIYNIEAVKNDEAMPFPLPSDEKGRFSVSGLPELIEKQKNCTVSVIGPGIGRSGEIVEITGALLRSAVKPVLLDADALWALSQNMGVLRETKAEVVLTPHEGEFLQMGGNVTGDRVSDAVGFAREFNCAVVLKGHETVIAFRDGESYLINAGNPGMATGGSGDVLSGVIGALLGQLEFRKAVVTGTWLHSYAGDLAAEKFGEYSMSAADIINFLPEALKMITDTE